MSPQPRQSGKPVNGAVEAVVKAEKLTQIAFILPVAVLVGWLLGAGLDKLLHQHWIFIAGLVLGAVAGFVQLFRLIAEPGLLGATAVDPKAPRGPGFSPKDDADETPRP